MTDSIFTSVAPYHILAYGTLLGTSFFHTFLNSPVLFKSTERPVFSSVQGKLFPIYFGIQSGAPAILALTFPGSTLLGFNSGVSGLLHESNKWGSLVPLTTMFVSGLLNLAVLLPASRRVMKARQGQAKRDGKEWYAPGPQSDEMRALSKRFGMLHGISSLLNLGCFIAAVVYGFTLGGRIQPALV